MLDLFEETAKEQYNEKPDNLQQLQLFTQKKANVYYIRYIINLAVQRVLKILKAKPAEQTETY